jgi:hypothetical protein
MPHPLYERLSDRESPSHLSFYDTLLTPRLILLVLRDLEGHEIVGVEIDWHQCPIISI